jgi:glycerol uptake operon antiterminator
MSERKMKEVFFQSLVKIPIVASVKDDENLRAALESECEIIFTLYGDICNIGSITETIKDAGKIAIVHIDLIDGLANREIAVRFLREYTAADGVISTRAGIIKAAREQGFIAIQRCFLIDSMAMENFKKHVAGGYADAVEILPAVMPKIIRSITAFSNIPLIIGGLLLDKEDVVSGLEAGAVAVSSTNRAIWTML